MTKKGQIFVVSAPSGAGKSSLVAKVCQLKQTIKVAISHTTRLMRQNEVDGQNYHFISVEQFKAQLNNNEFVESALVFGNYYGTSKKELETIAQQGNNVILEIDWQGAMQIKKTIAKATLIFIMPPDVATLKQRLISRNTDTQHIIEKRLAQAVDDMKHAEQFDYIVFNNDFDTAVYDLCSIIRACELKNM